MEFQLNSTQYAELNGLWTALINPESSSYDPNDREGYAYIRAGDWTGTGANDGLDEEMLALIARNAMHMMGVRV